MTRSRCRVTGAKGARHDTESLIDSTGAKERSRVTLSSNRAYLLTLLVMVYTSNYVDRVIIGVVGQALKTDLHLTD